MHTYRYIYTHLMSSRFAHEARGEEEVPSSSVFFGRRFSRASLKTHRVPSSPAIFDSTFVFPVATGEPSGQIAPFWRPGPNSYYPRVAFRPARPPEGSSRERDDTSDGCQNRTAATRRADPTAIRSSRASGPSNEDGPLPRPRPSIVAAVSPLFLRRY